VARLPRWRKGGRDGCFRIEYVIMTTTKRLLFSLRSNGYETECAGESIAAVTECWRHGVAQPAVGRSLAMRQLN
jgi:hypothetical protein